MTKERFCGFLFQLGREYVSLLLLSGSFSDPLDLLAYLSGGLPVPPFFRLARKQNR